jgi:hypothetical protein
MPLDLRLPLGLLFTVLGAVLAGAGVLSDARAHGVNVNVWWGVVLILFGTGSLALAGLRRRRARDGAQIPSAQTPRSR